MLESEVNDMIEIAKRRMMSNSCRCCNSQNDIFEILFKVDNSGTTVSICKECRKKLVELIEEIDK